MHWEGPLMVWGRWSLGAGKWVSGSVQGGEGLEHPPKIEPCGLDFCECLVEVV
jgi:hypothetical protein